MGSGLDRMIDGDQSRWLVIDVDGRKLGRGGHHTMKNLPIIVAIILLLFGIALMLGDFAFEANLPDWTSRAVIGIGILLTFISMMLSRRKPAN